MLHSEVYTKTLEQTDRRCRGLGFFIPAAFTLTNFSTFTKIHYQTTTTDLDFHGTNGPNGWPSLYVCVFRNMGGVVKIARCNLQSVVISSDVLPR